jgi:hypothetical protein
MRYKVRVGNDLPVQWSFFQDKAKTVLLSLSGRTSSGVTAYTKPQSGIPELGFAEAVRLKLAQGRAFMFNMVLLPIIKF